MEMDNTLDEGWNYINNRNVNENKNGTETWNWFARPIWLYRYIATVAKMTVMSSGFPPVTKKNLL